jgi:hypothetical protein
MAQDGKPRRDVKSQTEPNVSHSVTYIHSTTNHTDHAPEL